MMPTEALTPFRGPLLPLLPPPVPQGVGKTFTLELCLQRMGVLPVCLSAGELEDEWAGEPGRRLRERYEFAGALAQPGAIHEALRLLHFSCGGLASCTSRKSRQKLWPLDSNIACLCRLLCCSAACRADWAAHLPGHFRP